MAYGKCYMLFHAWIEKGEICTEVLECSAHAVPEFHFFPKKDYEDGKCKRFRPTTEWLHESWTEGSYKEELSEQIAKEAGIKDGEDRYFEYYADYTVIASRGWEGDYEEDESVENDVWQEISKEEYEKNN